jgi:hypothetical protein
MKQCQKTTHIPNSGDAEERNHPVNMDDLREQLRGQVKKTASKARRNSMETTGIVEKGLAKYVSDCRARQG